MLDQAISLQRSLTEYIQVARKLANETFHTIGEIELAIELFLADKNAKFVPENVMDQTHGIDGNQWRWCAGKPWNVHPSTGVRYTTITDALMFEIEVSHKDGELGIALYQCNHQFWSGFGWDYDNMISTDTIKEGI